MVMCLQFVKFTQLPTDLISYTASFCEPKTQNQLRATNSKIRAVVDLTRDVLTMTLPWNHLTGSTPISKLITLLKKFPNLSHLTVPRISSGNSAIFQPLISFLQDCYPTKLKGLSLVEVSDRSEEQTLTQDLFKAFAHGQLTSLKILCDPHRSLITNGLINDLLLEKCRNLTSFVFQSSSEPRLSCYSMHFSKCPKLKKIHLLGVQGLSQKTVEELSLCKNLTELTLSHLWGETGSLEKLLTSPHGLKLKHLDLQWVDCLFTDESLTLATRQLKELEVFSRCAVDHQVSDQGLIQVALNCRKLRTLKFNFKNVTDEGLETFASHAPQLEKLSAVQMACVSDKGIHALARRCKNLKALELHGLHHLNVDSLLTLARNCTSLAYLTLSYCTSTKGMDLKGLRQFVTLCKNLKYLSLSKCVGISDGDVKSLREEFPFLESISHRTFHEI